MGVKGQRWRAEYVSMAVGTEGWASTRTSVFQDAVERRDVVHHCLVRHGR